jgi:hypothetical protein
MLIGTAIDGLTLSQPVFIDEKARARHIYVLGQTGTGKSIALENMAAQAIQNGEGICFIDPHGQSAETLVSQIPETRADDLIYIDLANRETVPSLNFMTDIPLTDRPLAASNVVEGFKHIYGEDSWGPRMEYIFLCSVRSLMDNQLTLLALPRLFVDPAFRERVVLNTKDNFVRHTFWGQQFPAWQKKFGPELTSPIDNKIGALLSIPTLRAIVSQRKNSFTLREAMDNRKILIISLKKGQVGEASNLFGALTVSAIAQAALSRADIPETDRVPFSLIADEFHNFATGGFPLILSEARKYKLQLVLAHQGLEQIENKQILSAIFANCATFIALRIGAEDAPKIAKAFRRDDNPGAFLDIENYHAWYRPLINGNPGTPSHVHLSPPRDPLHDKAASLIKKSQRRFPRLSDIERKIDTFLAS